MSSRSATRQISIRLPDNEAQQIEELAAADGRSVANYTRRVLQAHLEWVKGER